MGKGSRKIKFFCFIEEKKHKKVFFSLSGLSTKKIELFGDLKTFKVTLKKITAPDPASQSL